MAEIRVERTTSSDGTVKETVHIKESAIEEVGNAANKVIRGTDSNSSAKQLPGK